MSEDDARRLLAKLDTLRAERKSLYEIAHFWMRFDGGLYVDSVHTVRKRWPRKAQSVEAEYEMTPREVTHFRDWAAARGREIDAEITSVMDELDGDKV